MPMTLCCCLLLLEPCVLYYIFVLIMLWSVILCLTQISRSAYFRAKDIEKLPVILNQFLRSVGV